MIDRHSNAWRETAKWAEAELSGGRTRLEEPGLDNNETQYLRGRIRTLVMLLALVDRPADEVIEPPTDEYPFQPPEGA